MCTGQYSLASLVHLIPWLAQSLGGLPTSGDTDRAKAIHAEMTVANSLQLHLDMRNSSLLLKNMRLAVG
jgi:hypothetical protein